MCLLLVGGPPSAYSFFSFFSLSLSLSLSWFVFFVASRGYTNQRLLRSCSLEEMANVALNRQCASTCLCLNSAIPKKRHVRPQRTSCLSFSLQLEPRLKERRLSHSDGLMKLTARRIIQVTEVMHPNLTSQWQFCCRFRPVASLDRIGLQAQSALKTLTQRN